MKETKMKVDGKSTRKIRKPVEEAPKKQIEVMEHAKMQTEGSLSPS
jgi:hypothetical protein